MKEKSENQRKSRTRPLLIGVIVDVSSSMSRNWKNKGNKSLPKIEVIRDTFNKQLGKISLFLEAHDEVKPRVHIFCLGMGFVLPQTFISVRLENGEEQKLEDGNKTVTRSDIVCDLIALSEMVPTHSLIEQVRINLNKRWMQYSGTILNQSSIEDDVFSKLRFYIRDTLRLTASSKLEKGWRVSLKAILKKDFLTKFNLGNNILEALEKNIKEWEEKILIESDIEADKFFNNIIKHADEIFQNNQQQYIDFIKKEATDFAQYECSKILELLTLGYNKSKILSQFNETKALDLAKIIYQKLDLDVRKSIALAWNINKINLIITEKGLGGSLDHKEVKRLTEQCIQKHGWSILKPFVENIVTDLFVTTFEELVKHMIPRWLHIAARREITRPIKQVKAILPEVSQQDIYSNTYMFGSTPIDEALERSTHRFLEKAHTSKRKILLIISDGEYETEHSTYLINMLKSIGVIVICCYISNKNVISKLTSKFSYLWPSGARVMFHMASKIEDHPDITNQLSQNGIEFPDSTKLFIQVNHPDILGQIMDAMTLSSQEI